MNAIIPSPDFSSPSRKKGGKGRARRKLPTTYAAARFKATFGDKVHNLAPYLWLAREMQKNASNLDVARLAASLWRHAKPR
jgi:hypothetical protein